MYLYRMFSWFIILSVILFVHGKNEDYMGYKIYDVKFNNKIQADRLDELKGDLIDFLRKPCVEHGITGKAMVPPSQQDWFEQRLADLGVERNIVIEDLFEHLQETDKSFKMTNRNDPERSFGFDGYYRYDEILAHINALQEAYVDSTISITVEEFGRTEQDRPVVFMKISDTSVQGDKPVVIIEAGIIPREWITIPASLNIVNRILEQTEFLRTADWIVIPVLNPDGYEYTHTNLRLWSKSMSTKSNLGFICPGVNINRNFNMEWLVSDSSSSPCSHLYAGIEPFSEIESQMVKYLLETYAGSIGLYISLQNSGGFISYPWQYEKAASGMFRQHLFLGLDMVGAMTEGYGLDTGWLALGDRASGTGSDYAQQSGVLYSLNIDVVQRGDDAVNIPEEEIVDIIEDVWRAVSVAASTLFGNN